MSTHEAHLAWVAGDGEDFLAGHYSRVHELSFDGGAQFRASASPGIVRAPWSSAEAIDPEEMFVASLSSCHMLWFLDFARHAGVNVRAYRDHAVGEMGKNAEGRTAILRVTLRPSIDCDADAATLSELHEKAHEACFIANSVKSEVVVETQNSMSH